MWRLQKTDGAIYGPTDWFSLTQWAREGRIEPGDQLAEGDEPWRPAAEIADLDLSYTILQGDGDTYGPIHLDFPRSLLDEGALPPDTPVITPSSPEPIPASLCVQPTSQPAAQPEADIKIARLTAENQALTERCDALKAETDSLQDKLKRAAAAPPVESPRAAELEAQLQRARERIQELEVQAHHLDEVTESAAATAESTPSGTVIRSNPDHREARRWQQVCEKEQADHQQTRERWRAESDELRRQIKDIQNHRDRLQHRINQLERSIEKLKAQNEGVELNQILNEDETYRSLQQLSANYDKMTEQLDHKNAVIQRLEQRVAKAEETAKRAQQDAGQKVEEARDEARQAQQAARDLETNYHGLLKSYRDLNERYIKLRQQHDQEPS
jgi:DNA repair exonuclease SbcCD ATPase subunit